MDQEKIGKFIKKLRKDNNLSQQAFADRLGVTFQAVSKWENGKNLPDIATLKLIKEEFNVNIDEIIDGDKITKKDNKYKLILTILALIIIILIIVIIIYSKSTKEEQYKFNELTSTNSDFKVSGSIVRTNDRTSLIINNVYYTGTDEDISYEELTCTLYEELNEEKSEVTSCDIGTSITLKEYLENLKIKMDHHSTNCTMFTESNMYIEINATKDNKTIVYRIPIQIDDESCD